MASKKQQQQQQRTNENSYSTLKSRAHTAYRFSSVYLPGDRGAFSGVLVSDVRQSLARL